LVVGLLLLVFFIVVGHLAIHFTIDQGIEVNLEIATEAR
jgi:hypothetical protein